MSRYLDPKSDIVFKKIFAEHPHLLKSFLNAVLPLAEHEQIVELEYLPTEQIPIIPILRRTIVDVKCKDRQGRVFVVEMQIEWTNSFMQRLLFGTAQAYVKQLQRGEDYHLLNPVYGLALIGSIFDRETPDWYHHYGLVKLMSPQEKVINGLTLVFVELPKFKTVTTQDKKLKILWLRFMREITNETKVVDPALLEVPEIKEAISLAEEAAYTEAELEAIESYWKAVSSERTLLTASRAEGEAKGRAEGEAKGRAEGRTEAQVEVAKKMKAEGLSLSMISTCTGLSLQELETL
jgi:predicted transposase/invertase (TIGR01784 family)